MGDHVVNLSRTPTLDELAAEPARVRDLPADVVAHLYYQALTVLSALGMGLSKPGLPARAGRSEEDCLIGPEQVAALIGMSVSWVEKHTRDLPERVSVLGNPRWRKGDIARWIKTRPAYGANSA